MNSISNSSVLIISVLIWCCPILLSANDFDIIRNGTYTITGRVIDNVNNPIVGSTVTLHYENQEDLFKGTISKDDGSFIFASVPSGRYIIKCSIIGYQDTSMLIIINDSDVQLTDIILLEHKEQIKEVVITGKIIETFADKTIYRLSELDRKSSSSALKSLELIPKIYIDGLSISTYSGKKVHVLINGINSNAEDLSVIKPDEILRIEYYENPPTRYAQEGVGAVINVILKKGNIGSTFALNAQNAVTTGFGNDVASLSYQNDRSRIGVKYRISYRKYNKRCLSEYLAYTYEGISYEKHKDGLNSPSQYEDQLGEFNYTFKPKAGTVFNTKLTLNSFDRKRSSRQDIKQILPEESNLIGISFDKDSYIKPVLDLYLVKTVNEKHDFLLNVVGTMHKTKYDYTYEESDNNNPIFNTSTLIDGEKYSVISDLMYSYSLKKHKISAGIKYQLASSLQDANNGEAINSEHIESNSYEWLGYLELTGNLKQLSYQLSSGVNYSSFQSTTSDKSYSFTSFRPIIALSYPLNKASDLRLTYQINTINPLLSELSSSTYLKDYYYAFSGNPTLEPYNRHQFALSYSFRTGRIYFLTDLTFQYSKDPILTYFKESSDYLLETLENLEREKAFKITSYLQLVPFDSKWLNLRLYGEVSSTENTFDGTSWKHNDFRFIPTVIFNYKKWNLSLMHQTKTKTLAGQLMRVAPSATIAELSYRPTKDWSTTLGLRYPFYKAWKMSSETHSSAIIQKRETDRIIDNANMVYFGLVYQFQFGRQEDETRRKHVNEDKDTGILQRQ